nr:VanZ family protein [Agromyces luteolus]
MTTPNEIPGGVLALGAWTDADTWTTGSAFEFAANVILFAVLGFLLGRALPRASPAALIAVSVLVTLSIEIAQIPLPRVSDPRDLIANTMGAVVGVLITRGRTLPARTIADIDRGAT